MAGRPGFGNRLGARCKTRRFLLITASATATAFAGAPGRAADDNWANSAASYQEWTTGANWSLGSAPTASQSAAVANNGWAKIDSAVTFGSLTIAGTSQVQLLD